MCHLVAGLTITVSCNLRDPNHTVRLKLNQRQHGLAVLAFFLHGRSSKCHVVLDSWTPPTAIFLFLREPEWAKENARATLETKAPRIDSEMDFYLIAVKISEFTAVVWC